MAEKHQTPSFEQDEKKIGVERSVPVLRDEDGLRTLDAGFSPDQVEAHLDPKEVRRILRKIDFRLIPLLAVLYL
jgi:hypothetical protein